MKDPTLNIVSQCDNFQGVGVGASSSSGVFSLRRVKFNSEFRSQLYVDDQLLDFVIVFAEATVLAIDNLGPWVIANSNNGASLINAYTI